MVSKVTNLSLNAENAVRIAKRIMKDRNMRVTNNFTPVVSEHTVQINPERRVRLSLNDTEFQYVEEQKVHSNWRQMLAYRYKDTREKVEERFIEFISSLSGVKK